VTIVGDRVGGWSAFIDGSWWTIRPSQGDLEAGQPAEIVAVEGVELVVEPRGEEDEL
jgi:membrane protein implicated in regulation of membrane protease activity